MHARKQVQQEETKVKVPQLEIVVPSVQALSQSVQIYLSERRVLEQIKEALKVQKLKLKPYEDTVKDELKQQVKQRALFHVDVTLEKQFGCCAGLRVAKRSRPEAFSEKRMEEVSIIAVTKILHGKFAPEHLAEIGKEICKEMLTQRKHNDVYSVELVTRKGQGKPHNKRQKK